MPVACSSLDARAHQVGHELLELAADQRDAGLDVELDDLGGVPMPVGSMVMVPVHARRACRGSRSPGVAWRWSDHSSIWMARVVLADELAGERRQTRRLLHLVDA